MKSQPSEVLFLSQKWRSIFLFGLAMASSNTMQNDCQFRFRRFVVMAVVLSAHLDPNTESIVSILARIWSYAVDVSVNMNRYQCEHESFSCTLGALSGTI